MATTASSGREVGDGAGRGTTLGGRRPPLSSDAVDRSRADRPPWFRGGPGGNSSDMAIISDLRDWRGKDVLASDGDKIGRLHDVYFDVETDQPLFIVVDTGRRGPLVMAPAWNATTSPEDLTLPYQPAAFEQAPTVDPDHGLSIDDEKTVFAYYKVDYQPSQTGSGRRLMRR